MTNNFPGFSIPAVRGIAAELQAVGPSALQIHNDLHKLLVDASDALDGGDPTGNADLLKTMAYGPPSGLPGILGGYGPDTAKEITRRCDILDPPGPSPYLTDVPLYPLQVFSDPVPNQANVTAALDALHKLETATDFGWNGNQDDLKKFDQQLMNLNPSDLQLFMQQVPDGDLKKYAGLLTNHDSGWAPWDWGESNGISDSDRRAMLDNLLAKLPQGEWAKFGADFPGVVPGFDTTDVYVNHKNGQTGKSTADIQWGVPAMPLFNGPVSYADVQQQQFADCWYLSSLIAVSLKNPQFIQDGIHQNENGTISVRIWDKDGNMQWVTVTPDLPVDGSGNPVGATGANGDLWPAYYEKAFALVYGGQKGGARDAKDKDRPFDHNDHGDYGAIEWNNVNQGPPYLTGNKSSGIGDNLGAITKAFNGGQPVIVASKHFDDVSKLPPPYNTDYVSDHIFYVLSTNKDGTVTLGNPWGASQPTLTVDEKDYEKYFDDPQAITIPSGNP